MRRLAALLLLVCPVAAPTQDVPQPPPPQRVREMPAQFICSVSRESPLGTVGAQQSVSLSGETGDPIFSWSAALGDRGISINSSWSRSPPNHSLVQLNYVGAEPGRTYRLRVEGLKPEGQSELQLDSGPILAEGSWIYVFTRWGTLTAILAEAYDPRLVLRGEDGAAIHSEPLDRTAFERARDMATRLEPDLAPLVADHRNRCRFHERSVLSR